MLCARRRFEVSFLDLGYSLFIIDRPTFAGVCGMALLAIFVSSFLYSQSEALARVVINDKGLFSYLSVVPKDEVRKTLVALYFGITAGLVEETIFRSYAWRIALISDYPVQTYFFIGAVVFGLVHWESGWANAIAAAIFGFVYCFAYLLLKNIWPLVIGHASVDYFWIT